MGLNRVLQMIRDEFDPLIDAKKAEFDAIRAELDVLRATKEDRLAKASAFQALRQERKRAADAIDAFDPAVVAVFTAEADLPPEP